jgi:hypothetical protein
MINDRKPIQPNLTLALTYSNMKLNNGNKNELGGNKSKCGENIVLFIENCFVNKVDQVLLPNHFSMKQNFAFH